MVLLHSGQIVMKHCMKFQLYWNGIVQVDVWKEGISL